MSEYTDRLVSEALEARALLVALVDLLAINLETGAPLLSDPFAESDADGIDGCCNVSEPEGFDSLAVIAAAREFASDSLEPSYRAAQFIAHALSLVEVGE